jgi:hypothetical protein
MWTRSGASSKKCDGQNPHQHPQPKRFFGDPVGCHAGGRAMSFEASCSPVAPVLNSWVTIVQP